MVDENSICCFNCIHADLEPIFLFGENENGIAFKLVECFARKSVKESPPQEAYLPPDRPQNCKHFERDNYMGVTVKQKEHTSVMDLANEIRKEYPVMGALNSDLNGIVKKTIKMLAQMPLDDVLRLLIEVSPSSMEKWLTGDPDAP